MALVHINAANNAALNSVTIKQGSALQHLDISNNPALETMELPAGLTSAFKDFIVSGAGFAELQDNKILKNVWDNIIAKLPTGDLETFLADIDDQDVVNFIYEGITLEKQWKTDPEAQEVVKAELGDATLSFDVNIPKVYTDDAEGGTATVSSNQASVTGSIKFIQPSPATSMTISGITGVVEIEDINGSESVNNLTVEGSVNIFPTITGYNFGSVNVNLTGDVTVPAGFANVTAGNNVTKATVDTVGTSFVGGTGLTELVITNEVTGTGVSIDLSGSALGKSEVLEGAWTNLLNKLGDSSTGTLKVNNGYVSAMIQNSGLLPAGWTLDPVAAYTGTIEINASGTATITPTATGAVEYRIDGGIWTTAAGEITGTGSIEIRGDVTAINVVGEDDLTIGGATATKLKDVIVDNTISAVTVNDLALDSLEVSASTVNLAASVAAVLTLSDFATATITGSVTATTVELLNVAETATISGLSGINAITITGAAVEGDVEGTLWTNVIGSISASGVIQLYETTETEYISRYWVNDLNEKLADGQSTLPAETGVVTISGALKLAGTGSVKDETGASYTLTAEGINIPKAGDVYEVDGEITGVIGSATISNYDLVVFNLINYTGNTVEWINSLNKSNATVTIAGTPDQAINLGNVATVSINASGSVAFANPDNTLTSLTLEGTISGFTAAQGLGTGLIAVNVSNSNMKDNSTPAVWASLITALPDRSATTFGTVTVGDQGTVNIYADQLEAKGWNTVPAAAAMITISGTALTGTITITPVAEQTVIVSNGADTTQEVTAETEVDLASLNVTNELLIIGAVEGIDYGTASGVTSIVGEDSQALKNLTLVDAAITAFDATQFNSLVTLDLSGGSALPTLNISNLAALQDVSINGRTNCVLTVGATNAALTAIDLTDSSYDVLYENYKTNYDTLIAALPATTGTIQISGDNQKLAQVINPMLEAKTWTTNVDSLPEMTISATSIVGFDVTAGADIFGIASDNTIVSITSGEPITANITSTLRIASNTATAVGISGAKGLAFAAQMAIADYIIQDSTITSLDWVESGLTSVNLNSSTISSGSLDLTGATSLSNLNISDFTGNVDISGITTINTVVAPNFNSILTLSGNSNLSSINLDSATQYADESKLSNWTTLVAGLFDRTSTTAGNITISTSAQQLAQIINPLLAVKNWATNVASLDEATFEGAGTLAITGTGLFGINTSNAIVPITSGEAIAAYDGTALRVAAETISEVEFTGVTAGKMNTSAIPVATISIGGAFTEMNIDKTALTAITLINMNMTGGTVDLSNATALTNVTSTGSVSSLNLSGDIALLVVTHSGAGTINVTGASALEELVLSGATEYDATGKTANWNTLIGTLPTHPATDPGIVTITNQSVANVVFPDLILKGWNIIPASNDYVTINGTEVGLSITGDDYVIVGANNVATQDASNLSTLTAPYKIYRDENITAISTTGSVSEFSSTPANTSITSIEAQDGFSGFVPANFSALTDFTANTGVSLDENIDFTGTVIENINIGDSADVTTLTVPTTIQSIEAQDAVSVATINGLSKATNLITLNISGTALDTVENIETLVGQLATRALTQPGTLTTTANTDSCDGAQKGWLVYPIAAPETVTVKGTLGGLASPITTTRNTVIKNNTNSQYSIGTASGLTIPSGMTDITFYGDAITAFETTIGAESGLDITDLDLSGASVNKISLNGASLTGNVTFGNQSVNTLLINGSEMSIINLSTVAITGTADLKNNITATGINVSNSGNVDTLVAIDASGCSALQGIAIPTYSGSSYPNGALNSIDVSNTAMGAATTITAGWSNLIDALPTRTEESMGAIEINASNNTLNALISPSLSPKFWATQIGAIASIEIFNGTTAVTSGLTITPVFTNGAVYAVGAESGTSVQLTSGQAANLSTLTGDTAVHIVGEVTGLTVDGAAVTDITGSDIEDLTNLSIQNSKIATFKADNFTTVTNLNISNNSVITSLDVSAMTALTDLTINNNGALTTLICDAEA